MSDHEATQELVDAIYADAAAGRLVGLMERYSVLDWIAATDCRAEDEGCADEAQNFVTAALMDYYNRREC